jgi:hypothetical protein
MRKTISACALVATLLPLASVVGPAVAAGALAVGSTARVDRDGIAVGTAINYDTLDEARAAALAQCRDYRPAPKAANRCKVIATFKDQCYGVAFDPKAGTPGAGWAIALTQPMAEQRALDQCRTTAGKTRQRFCSIIEAKCDGSQTVASRQNGGTHD